jgi:beta-galactosidase GanA
MRLRMGLLLCALLVLAAVPAVTRATSSAPQSASAPAAAAADPVSHTVSWDKYSLMVDGKRVFVWSGEVHAYRLPSPDLWRDILQKMKANGYDAVSFYFDWAYHSPKSGVYDFSGVRDVDKLLDIANQVGIYVIARPGPYINAEVDSGGYPGWLQETSGTARTNNATYMSYTDQWQTAIDAVLARHQLTNGTGSVILYQIENEYASNVTSQTGIQYMKHLYDKARADGITVPIFHNDKGRNGDWVPGAFTGADGLPGPNMYAFDSYPGGTCSTSGSPGTPGTPPDYGYYGSGGATGGSTASPNTAGFTAEFGGGWFDPWGDKLFNGAGYPCQAAREGANYEHDYYLTNVANGLKLQNIYMTFGGTNWGWLAAPVVYTSYDYGAAWDEARQPRDKVPAMKEMGYFVQSVDPIDKVDKGTTVTASNSGVKVYHLSNPDTGTQFYLPRHTSQSTSDLKFTIPITTADGTFTIPQTGQLELNGEDMKALVADYDMDSQHLVYSTADLMTHGTIAGQDFVLFDGRNNQTGEAVLHYATQPTVNVLSGSGVTSTWDATSGNLLVDYTLSGLAQVQITGGGGTARPLLLMATDDTTAATLWRQDTSAGPVVERGPSLVRSATISADGQTLVLTGDDKTASDLEVWAPATVQNVTWNGQAVATTATASGSLKATAQVAGPPAVALPVLSGWKYHSESPEAQPSFDDSTWQLANKTTTTSNTPLTAGQKDLYADDYGFHYGDVWYRGTYATASAATALAIKYQAGTVGMIEVWLDGSYLGANQLPTPTSSQSTTATWSATATFAIPAALRDDTTHTIAVLYRPMAHEEDGGANNAFKNARGILSATLTGSTQTIGWKIQGDQGGEDITDPVRGVMNNGGLYGENAGWSLEGYPDANWTPVSLPYSDPTPGVAWYRTTFDLNEPSGIDASLGLNITDPATKQYRALIFVNGWNLGQYINDVGPQHTFVLPNGILRTNGHNTLSIAVITNNAGGLATGGGLGTVSLVNLGTVASGLTVSDVGSPAYQAPTVTPAPITATAGQPFSGTVATIGVPPDALGTALVATIDWGDGTTTSQALGTGNASYTLTGTHTYAAPYAYPVKVTVSDKYGSADLASASELAQVPVTVGGTVGGSVPATLALTIGGPASFGAFVPGVTADYTAQTSANVISTAGDALLSVADPSATATGHLVNGAFSLPSPLQARARDAANTGTAYNNVGSAASPLNLLSWAAPISNDAVSLQFSQHIGSTDALRTGAYGETLTFTLSTTTP